MNTEIEIKEETIEQKIQKLKKHLPKSFAKKCVERLSKKGIKVTQNAVWQVTSLNSRNEVIISELALMVIENEKPLHNILDKALNSISK